MDRYAAIRQFRLLQAFVESSTALTSVNQSINQLINPKIFNVRLKMVNKYFQNLESGSQFSLPRESNLKDYEKKLNQKRVEQSSSLYSFMQTMQQIITLHMNQLYLVPENATTLASLSETL